MSMTVRKSADVKSPTKFYSNNGKVADIPAGVSVAVANLNNGVVLSDGTPIGVESSGVRSVCKTAKCETGTTTTAIKVLTAGNQFKVGDKIFALLNGKHYAITGIVSADGIDTMTVGTAIDAPLSNGGFVYQNADVADGATGAALAVSPVAITGTNTLVDTSTNLTVDAWVIAAVKRDTIGGVVLDALKANYASISVI